MSTFCERTASPLGAGALPPCAGSPWSELVVGGASVDDVVSEPLSPQAVSPSAIKSAIAGRSVLERIEVDRFISGYPVLRDEHMLHGLSEPLGSARGG